MEKENEHGNNPQWLSGLTPNTRVAWVMGPAVSVLFVLVTLVVVLILGPIGKLPQFFQRSEQKQEDVVWRLDVLTHFQWAECVNNADTKEKIERCVPPLQKKEMQSLQNSYMFNEQGLSSSKQEYILSPVASGDKKDAKNPSNPKQ